MENDDKGLTELVIKAKRKLKYEEGDEHEWLKNKNKILRMQGQDYKGLKQNEMGKFSFTESRSARQLGKICESTFCKKIQVLENVFLSKMKIDNNCFPHFGTV